MNSKAYKAKVAAINDALRSGDNVTAGRIVMTQGFGALPDDEREAAILRVKLFNTFTEDNDPHGEHDFGGFESDAGKIFWKIDYYDQDLSFLAPDPSDEKSTIRILTIMLASEY